MRCGIRNAYLTPTARPWRSGYVESFDSRIREECLNINISLGYQPTAVCAAGCTHR